MNLSIAEAAFIALFLETLLYGVFLTLYLISLSVLLTKTGVQRRILIPVATMLLCISTAHLVIAFVGALEAFVFKVPANADAYYANRAEPLILAYSALYGMQTTLADAVIVWRCYVLNHRSLLFAIPGCIAVLANGITAFYIVCSLSRNPGGATLPAPGLLTTDGGCVTAFYTLTMVTSVTCTSLIAWRIYRAPSFISDGSPSLLPIFIVIIETGTLYTTSVLALLIAFLSGSNGQFIVLDAITPIVGISFCLLILQVHFQVGGNPSTKYPAEPRGIADLFRARDVRGVGSIGRITVPSTVTIMEEDRDRDGPV